MFSRRGLLGGLGALVAMPAVARVAPLMKLRGVKMVGYRASLWVGDKELPMELESCKLQGGDSWVFKNGPVFLRGGQRAVIVIRSDPVGAGLALEENGWSQDYKDLGAIGQSFQVRDAGWLWSVGMQRPLSIVDHRTSLSYAEWHQQHFPEADYGYEISKAGWRDSTDADSEIGGFAPQRGT